MRNDSIYNDDNHTDGKKNIEWGQGSVLISTGKHSSLKNSKDPGCLNIDRWEITTQYGLSRKLNRFGEYEALEYTKSYFWIYRASFGVGLLAWSLSNSKPVVKRKTQSFWSFCLMSRAMIWDRKKYEFRKHLCFYSYLSYFSLNMSIIPFIEYMFVYVYIINV